MGTQPLGLWKGSQDRKGMNVQPRSISRLNHHYKHNKQLHMAFSNQHFRWLVCESGSLMALAILSSLEDHSQQAVFNSLENEMCVGVMKILICCQWERRQQEWSSGKENTYLIQRFIFFEQWWVPPGKSANFYHKMVLIFICFLLWLKNQ